jgi:hypothetical protein
MSTRRSTRAASSRAASPTDAPTPQRRTARRAGNAQLPAVNLRASTAYGTNTTPLMSGRSGHDNNQQLTDVLHKLLPPKADDTASSKSRASQIRAQLIDFIATTGRSGRGRGRPRAGDNMPIIEVNHDRSYVLEDNLFRRANFDTSSISQPSDNIHDEPEVEIPQPDPMLEDPRIHQHHHQQQQQQQSARRKERVRNLQNQWKIGTPGVPDWVSDFIDWIKELFISVVNLAAFLLSK